MPGLASEIPSRAVVSVSPATAKFLGVGMVARRCDLTANGTKFSVLVARSYATEDGDPSATNEATARRVRIPLSIRLMVGANVNELVHIERQEKRLPSEWWSDVRGRVHWPDSWNQGGVVWKYFLSIAGLYLVLIRRIQYVLEVFLRLLLGAPTYCLMSTKANPGDDPFDVVRVHPAVTNALGVFPGSRVILSWRGRSTLVRIAEETHLHEMDSVVERIKNVGSVHAVHDEPLVLPGTLVIQVGSQVRKQLGMPPETIVEIRRSVGSVVVRNLSSLVIPLFAAVLSVIGLDGNSYKWLIGLGVGVLGVLLVLGSSRIPRRPYGLWP